MSDYSIYPKAIDGYAQIPLAVDKRSPINAESVNRLRSGIINVEKAIGIAPGFSFRFGEFPDLAGRTDNIEELLYGLSDSFFDLNESFLDFTETIRSDIRIEINKFADDLDISTFFEDLTLTSLYERDSSIRLSDSPLFLEGNNFLELLSPDNTHVNLFTDENFVIAASDRNIQLQPGGVTSESLIIPTGFMPNCVIINSSEEAPLFPEDSQDYGRNVKTYLALGNSPEDSDLLFASTLEEGVYKSIAIVSGLNASTDESVYPPHLDILTNPPLMKVNSPNINLDAADTIFEDQRAGDISLNSGNSPAARGGQLRVGGASPVSGGICFLESGDLDDGDASGASLTLWGAMEGVQAGHVFIMGGNAQGAGVNGGHVTLWAGNSDNGQGGRLLLRSGASGDGEPTDVVLVTGSHPDLGDGAGHIDLVGRPRFQRGISMPIRFWSSSGDGDVATLNSSDYTVIAAAYHPNVKVNLPKLDRNYGRVIVIKRDANSVGTFEIAVRPHPDDGGLIDNVIPEVFLSSPGRCVTIQASQSFWHVIGT